MFLIVALVLSIGLSSQTMAAPVQGKIVADAAAKMSPVIKVPCAWRRPCPRCVARRVCW